jgi:hypothetical protein
MNEETKAKLERCGHIAHAVTLALNNAGANHIEAVIAIAMLLGRARDDKYLELPPQLMEAVNLYVNKIFPKKASNTDENVDG